MSCRVSDMGLVISFKITSFLEAWFRFNIIFLIIFYLDLALEKLYGLIP